jgi:hypothetical protein
VRKWWSAVGVLWGLYAAVGIAIVVTYSRVAPQLLYNVGEEGLASGAGRLLVFLNYPVSIAAIAIAWLAAERIATRNAYCAAAAVTVLCAVTAWPGVVDQEDLDAKPINVVPALGVALALALSLRAGWERVERRRLDPLRVAIAVVLGVAAVPWAAAVLGFYAPGDVYLGEELRLGGEGGLYAAVHLGDHEGLDGTLLALSALLLSRRRTRAALTYFVALMFVYGLAVAATDFWFEQVVKRDWTDVDLPSLLRPALSIEWLVALLVAAALTAAVRRLEGPRQPGAGPRRTSPSPPPDRPSAGSTTDAPSP